MCSRERHVIHLSACKKGGRCRLPSLFDSYIANVSFSPSSSLSVKTFQAQGLSTEERKDRYVEATIVKYLPSLEHPPTVEDYNGGKMVLPDAAQLGTISDSQIYFFGETSQDYTAILIPKLKTSGNVVQLETKTICTTAPFDQPINLTFVAVLKYLAV